MIVFYRLLIKKTTLLESFKIVDDILRQGVQGIAELITIPGLINVDFADVKTIMKNAGSALMGIGTGSGENRAVEAAKTAISSPLLELSIDGARGILFTITGGPDMTMSEVSDAAKIVTSSAAEDAKVIFGATIDESMNGHMRIAVIATGFDDRRPSFGGLEEDVVSAQPFFSTNKYTPSNFMRRVQKDEEEEEKKFKQIIHNPAPTPIVPGNIPRTQPAPLKDKNSDEDLEIPAFIRKKMGI
jgi:cell division protein FtsZ